MATLHDIPTELLEHILTLLCYTEVLETWCVSKYFNSLIDTSPRLQQELFLRPKEDRTVWLLGRSSSPNIPALDRTFPGLFEEFGIDSRFSAAVPVNSDQALAHSGPIVHPAQFSPQFSKLKTFWKHGVGREVSKKDDFSFVRLRDYIHDDPGNAQKPNVYDPAASLQAMYRRVRFHRCRFQVWGMLRDMRELAVETRPYAKDWRVKDCKQSWAGMLLTQPPTRSVIFQINVIGSFLGPAKRIVKHVVVPDGVRFGHLMAALDDEQRQSVREAEKVNTVLLLQGVVKED